MSAFETLEQREQYIKGLTNEKIVDMMDQRMEHCLVIKMGGEQTEVKKRARILI